MDVDPRKHHQDRQGRDRVDYLANGHPPYVGHRSARRADHHVLKLEVVLVVREVSLQRGSGLEHAHYEAPFDGLSNQLPAADEGDDDQEGQRREDRVDHDYWIVLHLVDRVNEDTCQNLPAAGPQLPLSSSVAPCTRRKKMSSSEVLFMENFVPFSRSDFDISYASCSSVKIWV